MATATLPLPLAFQEKRPPLRKHLLGEEQVIGAFLSLLDKEIEAGRNLHEFSESMVSEMREFLDDPVDMDEEIEGPVALG